MTALNGKSASIGSILNIIDVLRNEGIPIRESPKGGRFRCPFHDDTHPSAFAYAETNRFFCFGCGERGDAIDFIMKLRGLTFRRALTYLGIEGNHEGYGHVKANDSWKRKKLLIKAFRKWERKYYDNLALIYRVSHKLLKGFKTMAAVERFAPLYQELPLIEQRMDVLLHGTDREKYELLKEVSGV